VKVTVGGTQGKLTEPRGAARMARIFAALLSADLVTRALAAVATVVVVRTLAPSEFGEVAFVLATAATIGVLADLGLPLLLVRDISANPDSAPRLLGAALECVAVLGGTVFGLAALITLIAGAPGPATAGAMVVGLLVLAANSLIRPLEASLTGYGRAHLITLANAIRGATLVAGTALVAVTEPSPVAFLGAAAAAETVGLLVLASFSSRKVPRPVFGAGAHELIALARRSLPFALLAGFSLIYLRIDLIMLGLLGSHSAVGNYGVAARILDTSLAVPAYFGGAFLATVAQTGVGGRQAAAQTETALRYLLLIAVPLAFVLAFAADPLVRLVAGASYDDAGTILIRLTPVLVLASAYAVLGNLQVAVDRIRLLAGISLAGIALKLALNAWAIPLYGANGAALAAVGGELLVVGAQWYFARDDIDAARLAGWCGRLAIAAVAMVGVGLLALDMLSWPAAVALGLPTFALIALLTRVISIGELRMVLGSVDIGRPGDIASP
jgi:O-antigen/teichoic acid export membrane protein